MELVWGSWLVGCVALVYCLHDVYVVICTMKIFEPYHKGNHTPSRKSCTSITTRRLTQDVMIIPIGSL